MTKNYLMSKLFIIISMIIFILNPKLFKKCFALLERFKTGSKQEENIFFMNELLLVVQLILNSFQERCIFSAVSLKF